MMPDLSLAHLTVLSLSPPEAITVAARTGYQFVGIRMIRASADTPGYPLMDDAPMMRETRARLSETGIRVLDIEVAWLRPETRVRDFERFFEAGATLGARNVITAGTDPERKRLIDRYAELCERAAPFGLTMALEFIPWTDVRDLPSAVEIVGPTRRSSTCWTCMTITARATRPAAIPLATIRMAAAPMTAATMTAAPAASGTMDFRTTMSGRTPPVPNEAGRIANLANK